MHTALSMLTYARPRSPTNQPRRCGHARVDLSLRQVEHACPSISHPTRIATCQLSCQEPAGCAHARSSEPSLELSGPSVAALHW
eukprot:3852982-Rhodomonas_salina.4